MFNAYVRRGNGRTSPVQWRHSGQHVGVQEGRVRLARLYWDQSRMDGEEQPALALLLQVTPLVDTLILTRQDSAQGEMVVFHGLITESGTDGATVSVIAVDNPSVDRLFEHPFNPTGPLVAADQKPQAAYQVPPPSAQSGPLAAPVGPVGPATLAPSLTFPAGVRHLSQSEPAARPGGNPAGQVSGPTPTGWTPSGRLSSP